MEVDTANLPEGDVKEEKMEVEEEQGAKEEKEKVESNPCQTGGQCVSVSRRDFCLWRVSGQDWQLPVSVRTTSTGQTARSQHSASPSSAS